MVPPHIICIVLDTLRADRVLSNNNNNKNLTPFIKSILNNSIFFENCIAPSPWTLPSHISMFTGLYSIQIKQISKKIHKLNNKIPILTEILKDIGYNTMCFTENPFISNVYGLTRGFNEVFESRKKSYWIEKKYKLSEFLTFLQKINSVFKKRLKSKKILQIWAYINKRIDWYIKKRIFLLITNSLVFKIKNDTIYDLERYGKILKNHLNSKPYYLFFNIMTCHDPYIPIKELFNTFGIKIKDFKIIKESILSPIKVRIKVDMGSKRLSEKKVRVIKKLYDACVRSNDIIVEKIFSILEELGILGNSYVIITSDHGEHLGDKLGHYLWGHRAYVSVFDELMKVPFLVYHSSFEKKIEYNQVQLKDFFHTILHLTGILNPQNKYFDIKKSIIYQTKTNFTPKYIFGEFLKVKDTIYRRINSQRKSLNRSLVPKIYNHIYFLRTNEFKYIKYNKIKNEEFYNLKSDPYEQNNIFNEVNINCRKMKMFMENLLKTIKNPENLKAIITQKEKDTVKKIVSRIKINRI